MTEILVAAVAGFALFGDRVQVGSLVLLSPEPPSRDSHGAACASGVSI